MNMGGLSDGSRWQCFQSILYIFVSQTQVRVLVALVLTEVRAQICQPASPVTVLLVFREQRATKACINAIDVDRYLLQLMTLLVVWVDSIYMLNDIVFDIQFPWKNDNGIQCKLYCVTVGQSHQIRISCIYDVRAVTVGLMQYVCFPCITTVVNGVSLSCFQKLIKGDTFTNVIIE